MPIISDDLILSCLLEEDDDSCDEAIQADDDCEADHLSVASDHQSEEDAEDVDLNLIGNSYSQRNVQKLHCNKSTSSSKAKPPSCKPRHSKKQKPTIMKQKVTRNRRTPKKIQTPPVKEPVTNTFVPESQEETQNIPSSSRQSNTSDDMPLSLLIQNTSLPESSSSQPGKSSSSVNCFTGKDGTKWMKKPVRTCVRTTRENIITEVPGVKSHAQNKKSHLECFELFLSKDILYAILVNTNEKICTNSLLKNNAGDKIDYTRSTTSIEELKAFIGLLLLAGLYRAGRENLEDLWATDGTGIDIFRCTMTRNRFSFLLDNLRFDNMLTRTERAKKDKLAPIRDIFEYFVLNCQDIYSPYEYLTLDEELVAFRGRCGFRQYIPSKPAKYGIKIYALVDCKTFYTINLEIYCGQQPEGSPYAVSNKPYDLVDRMVRCVSGSSRNVTMDNFFTSYESVKNLLERHTLTAVGTLRENKTCLPAEFKARREENSSLFGFQKDITLVSYVPKPRKMVYLMSSLHHDGQINEETGRQQKPEIITFYNQTKSGVDVVDKLCRTYDVSRNSERWPLTVFFSILNHAAINAMIVYLLNNNVQSKKTNYRRHFIKKLGLSLLEEHLGRRQENERLPKELRKRIGEHLDQPSFIPPTKKAKYIIQRCAKCPRKKDRKTKYSCEKCCTPLCLEHCKFTCNDCCFSEESDEVYL